MACHLGKFLHRGAIIFSYYYYVHLWETHFKDMNVTFFCDDLSVVEILKKQTSPDPALMRLLRQFVVFAMCNNFMFVAQHININTTSPVASGLASALTRILSNSLTAPSVTTYLGALILLLKFFNN